MASQKGLCTDVIMFDGLTSWPMQGYNYGGWPDNVA